MPSQTMKARMTGLNAKFQTVRSVTRLSCCQSFR